MGRDTSLLRSLYVMKIKSDASALVDLYGGGSRVFPGQVIIRETSSPVRGFNEQRCSIHLGSRLPAILRIVNRELRYTRVLKPWIRSELFFDWQRMTRLSRFGIFNLTTW